MAPMPGWTVDPNDPDYALLTGHDTGVSGRDAIISGAHQTLQDLNTDPLGKALAGINASSFPLATALKAQHPGAYDHITDDRDLADLEQRLATQQQAGGEGYHPGLADATTRDTNNSLIPSKANLLGLLSGMAEGATSPEGKAAIGGAASLLGPAGVPVAAAVEGGANLLGSHFNNANAPTSTADFFENMGETAAPAAVAGGLGLAKDAFPAAAGLAQKYAAPIGGVVGGVHGYQRNGVPGAIEEGGLGYLGGKMFGKLPGSAGKYLRMAAGMAPEAEAAVGAEAGVGAGAAEAATPKTSAAANYARSMGANIAPENIVPDPAATNTATDAYLKSQGLKDVTLVDPSGRPLSSAEPEGFQWPEGKSPMDYIRAAARNPTVHAPDTSGVPLGPEDMPSFTHEGQNLNGHPPAVGGTSIPPEPFRALSEVHGPTMDRMEANIRRDAPGLTAETARLKGTPWNPHTVERLSVPPSKAALRKVANAVR